MYKHTKSVICGDVSVSFYKCTKSGSEGVAICQDDDSIEMSIEQYRALIDKLSSTDKELS
jgi:hypothetical protein